jgi:hypothetical protein
MTRLLERLPGGKQGSNVRARSPNPLTCAAVLTPFSHFATLPDSRSLGRAHHNWVAVH